MIRKYSFLQFIHIHMYIDKQVRANQSIQYHGVEIAHKPPVEI